MLSVKLIQFQLVLLLSVLWAVQAEAVEINIGQDNVVNTGTMSGGNCVEGRGPVVSETRKPGSFQQLEIDGSFHVLLEVGTNDSPRVELKMQPQLLPQVETRVDGETLKVFVNGSICSTEEMTLLIHVPRLQGLKVYGANEVEGRFSGDRGAVFRLELYGSSSVSLRGAGAQTLQCTVADSGEFDGRSFPVAAAEVHAADTGVAKITVREAIEGASTDASEIHVWGNPPRVRVEEADVGELVLEE